jgi:hypothetical protein
LSAEERGGLRKKKGRERERVQTTFLPSQQTDQGLKRVKVKVLVIENAKGIIVMSSLLEISVF